MQTTFVRIDELKFSDYNPREISIHDFESLKRSIRRYGLVEPIVANHHLGRENVIVGGHQRVRAAKALGIAEVPVIYVDLPVSEEQLLNLALNRIKGDWQEEQLVQLIGQIESGQDLGLTGFTDQELDKLLYGALDAGGVREDEFRIEDALPKGDPKTKPGEIVELGPHRLACGDARDEVLMKRLLSDPVDLLFTDPPYNVAYQGGRLGAILNDAQAPEDFQRFITDAFRVAFDRMRPGAAFYVCMGWSSYPAFIQALKPIDLHLANIIIWVKDNATMGWHDYRYKHELVVKGNKRDKEPAHALAYGWKKGDHYFAPTREEADVWHIKKRHSRDYVHPTQKPLALITRAINNSSRTGELVFDPFGGSGSTLIAAEVTGRRCVMAELDPRYCDVIRDRYSRYLGDTRLAVHPPAAGGEG